MSQNPPLLKDDSTVEDLAKWWTEYTAWVKSLKLVHAGPIPTSVLVERGAREYSIYVNITRAIARANDGLKVGQRIALWLLRTKAEKIKTGALAGEMLASELYVHGELSAINSIALLAAPFKNNVPLITAVSDSGFGSRANPGSIIAPRYTYVKRSKFAERILYEDFSILPMTGNYDDSKLMPETFLPVIPLILLNGVSGSGVGFATNILPRGLDDLVSATTRAINGEKVGKLKPKMEGFDLSVKETQPGKFVFSGAIRRDGSNRIIVSELPPGLTLEKFKEHLFKLEEEKLIQDVIDHTSDAINVEVKFSRAYLHENDDDAILDLLRLRTTETENLTVQSFDGARIVKYDTPQALVEDFVKWRFTWYSKRYEQLLFDERNTHLYWLSVLTYFKAKIPDRLRSIKSKTELVQMILAAIKEAGLKPVSDHADRIAGIPGYKLTQEGLDEATEKAKESAIRIAEYETILKSPKRQKEIFRTEVEAIRFRDFR